MKILLSHPTGNANVRQAALGCAKAGILSNFYTSLAVFDNNILDKLATIKALSELDRRRFDNLLRADTKMWPWLEVGRIAAQKLGLKSLVRHEEGPLSVDAVYSGLDKKVACQIRKQYAKGLTAVYAYEDGALHTFKEAKKYGIKCIYDLPIGYWKAARKLLNTEHERWPEWASTLIGLQDSAVKLSRKDEELNLADHIVVASSFTASTLMEYPGKLAQIEVIPYGFPAVYTERKYLGIEKRPLKLLFVGGLSQRKGIADLFTAVDNIGNHVELTVVGAKTSQDCPALDAALKKHTWIPSLPHEKILELMRQHDVLVFPSLFEGFGLVITEAMSQGTPVITTDRTAGPDLINDGSNGWIIEAGSTNALQEAIEKLLERPKDIAEIGTEAMNAAKKRPWESYGKELSDALLKM
ncbi:glycosyltransferase family 4 protein [Pedobacter sp. MC2016-14]|uniref:glycosyltransferase family 4 protein n=1 Tax=Pedobacter sp. MC2016-14 TaxID=2897327 RepID=UPI001E3EC9E1|nr:glycosyltransferase family 4 protein [Pedobacter sp. MC2016-14]MCD0486861.1 glycosyltransferase family 4 protein [Pedobacter sp. MC2016-14]